jgi:hypothetical protein
MLPSTWRLYSKEIEGRVLPHTAINEKYITSKMVAKWLSQGYSEKQIFLMWNSGRSSGCSSGINKYGVKYDSCAYVDKALAYLNQR